ncbi:uncharacterized protein HMF8227_00353 [Saliniradius amylolyticus]|uniref:DUF416 family protein n=1 Tax=Saliniradius amylolyticus TaxID=2183582 RepID=A0A2S2DZS7_9ALTE|nr:YjaG family protein [Saliniradius amylolyticus]AWL10859.1 uncharacterized protein HMF8227_00353 [Saliniradius amylolyticus]
MKLNIFQRVRELEHWQAVAFGATLLERSLPNYELFCELTDSGDPKLCRNVLDSIWGWLANPKSKINLALQQEKVDAVIPEVGEHDNFGVYPAIDAGMSLSALLALMSGEDPQGAVVISKLSQGSVDAFIQATEPELEEVKEHPLMQWEIEFQSELLDELAEAKRGSECNKRLRQLATEEGITNIGIEL